MRAGSTVILSISGSASLSVSRISGVSLANPIPYGRKCINRRITESMMPSPGMRETEQRRTSVWEEGLEENASAGGLEPLVLILRAISRFTSTPCFQRTEFVLSIISEGRTQDVTCAVSCPNVRCEWHILWSFLLQLPRQDQFESSILMSAGSSPAPNGRHTIFCTNPIESATSSRGTESTGSRYVTKWPSLCIALFAGG